MENKLAESKNNYQKIEKKLFSIKKGPRHLSVYTPIYKSARCFPGGLAINNLPPNAGDSGLIPDLGRSCMPGSN